MARACVRLARGLSVTQDRGRWDSCVETRGPRALPTTTPEVLTTHARVVALSQVKESGVRVARDKCH